MPAHHQLELSIDRVGKAHHNAPATSHDAARAIKGVSGKQRLAVYEAIANAPLGLTDQEIEDRLGLPGSSVRPRRKELQEKGYIVATGDRRLTASGRHAVVWRINPRKEEETHG